MTQEGYWQVVPRQNNILQPLDVTPTTTPSVPLDLNTFLQVLTLVGVCVVIGMFLMKRDK